MSDSEIVLKVRTIIFTRDECVTNVRLKKKKLLTEIEGTNESAAQLCSRLLAERLFDLQSVRMLTGRFTDYCSFNFCVRVLQNR